MSDPSDMRFTTTHEWALRKEDTILIGITDYAQHQLADITHVDLPVPDEHHYDANEEICIIESLRTTQDCRAPVPGRIVAINTELLSRPELISADPYGEGWLVEMQPDDMSELDDLLQIDEYESIVPDDEEE